LHEQQVVVFYTQALKNNCLIDYIDNDFAGSIDDRKSTPGYVFHIGLGAISWAFKKQPIVTISSAEVEYVATTIQLVKQSGYKVY